MSKLWRSGALSEDKVQWLSYLTNIFTDLATHMLKLGLPKESVSEIAPDFDMMWNMAISSGSAKDLLVLHKDLDRILDSQMYSKFTAKIRMKLQRSLKSYARAV
jgi:hypothetical protein